MKNILYVVLSLVLLSSCKKENPQLGDAPSTEDAAFTYSYSSSSANIVNLSATNKEVLCIWDLGNGSKDEGTNVEAKYPYAGTYVVKLTVFSKGGSKTSTKQIVIDQDDLTLLNNPIYSMLTGGVSGLGYKTWYIDSASIGHFGVGPDPESALGPVPEWWAAGVNAKANVGLYNDRYIFHLNGFKFDMVTNSDVYVHNSLAGQFPGSFLNAGDYTAPYTDKLDRTWILTEGTENTITISNDAFIGFYTGVKTYRIISITDSTLSLQYKHHDGGFHWYLNLKSI